MDEPSSTTTPSLRFHTFSQLRELKGIEWSNPILLRKEALGLFPQRTYLSVKRPVWLESEVNAWMVAKMNAPRTPNTLTAKATAKWKRNRRDRQAAAIPT